MPTKLSTKFQELCSAFPLPLRGGGHGTVSMRINGFSSYIIEALWSLLSLQGKSPCKHLRDYVVTHFGKVPEARLCSPKALQNYYMMLQDTKERV